MKNMGKGFLNVIAFAVGLAILVWAFGAMQVNRSNWSSMEGQVMSSTGNLSSEEGSESSTYEYIVDDVKYKGFSAEGGYAVGQKITVYYDPANPGDSSDDPGGDKIFAIVCFIFGLWVVGSRAWELYKLIRAATQQDMA
jgi:hypothetical protein